MLYKVMSYLFHNNDYYRYIPKPSHLIWSLFYMAVGVVSFVWYDWYIFGVITFLLGAGLGLVIVLGMGWDKAIEHWEKIAYVFEAAGRVKDPIVRAELLQAMGFHFTPSQVEITEVKQETKDSGYQVKFHRLPVSPATMQLLADTVLHSGNTEFTESDYSHIPNIRKVRNYLKKEGFLSQKNKKNYRLGYTFNRKGVDTLYQYASESIKQELKKREQEMTR